MVKDGPIVANGASVNNQGRRNLSIEDAAATKIQSSYRAHAVCCFPCYLLLSF